LQKLSVASKLKVEASMFSMELFGIRIDIPGIVHILQVRVVTYQRISGQRLPPE
jgi:hypothetical protein